MHPTCSICTEVITDTATLNCQHVFCYDCILAWCKQTNTCPLCRAIITRIDNDSFYQPVGKPKIPYAERMNEYIARRDFLEFETSPNDADLTDFISSGSEPPSSSFDEDDLRINGKPSASDYEPIATRTRLQLRRTGN